MACDAECSGGCTGPAGDQCSECKHVLHEGHCLAACTALTYQDGSGERRRRPAQAPCGEQPPGPACAAIAATLVC